VVTVTHTKVSAVSDDADTGQVRPSDWNAAHTIAGLGTGVSDVLAKNVGVVGAIGTGRQALTGNTTFYINADTGVDSPSNGLTAGTPWETPQYAHDYVAANYDLAGFLVTFQLQDATAQYSGVNGTKGFSPSTASTVYWRGNPTTPANVEWNGTVHPTLRQAPDTVRVVMYVNGVTISNDDEALLDATNPLARIVLGHPSGSEACNVVVTNVPSGRLMFEGAVSMSAGNLVVEWTSNTNEPTSLFATSNTSGENISGTITINGTPTFQHALLSGGFMFFNGTVTGSFNGPAYSNANIRNFPSGQSRQGLASGASEASDIDGLGPYVDRTGNSTHWSATGIIAAKTQTVSPSSGATVTVAENEGTVIINGAGTIGALTIALKADPFDDEVVKIIAPVAVTAVTFSGGTFIGAPSGLAIGLTQLRYNLANDYWVANAI
jgi:hypothetical protein